MTSTIFYSWQSDSDAKLNRNFIEDAINKAIAKLGSDIEVVEALRGDDLQLDKDTKGVPGSPAIVDTILEKIEGAGIFIGDLTFITNNGSRYFSNPNVLIEYGWALARLGKTNIVQFE